jgi:hypothetical protein
VALRNPLSGFSFQLSAFQLFPNCGFGWLHEGSGLAPAVWPFGKQPDRHDCFPVEAAAADRFREWAGRALALGLPVEGEPLRLEWVLTPGWKTALTEEVSEPFVQAPT